MRRWRAKSNTVRLPNAVASRSQACTISSSSSPVISGRPGSRYPRYLEVQARAFLKISDHAEEIFGLRIAPRPEHANEALGRRSGRFAKLLKADGRLDVVAQDRLAGLHIAGQHGVDAFAQERLGESRVRSDLASDQFLEAFCSRHLLAPVIASCACLPGSHATRQSPT